MPVRLGFTAPKQPAIRRVKRNLFAEGFLRMADSDLNLPGYLFGHAFAFQVGIVGHLAGLFLDLALYLVNLADDLILNAWLHLADSCAGIRLAAEGENTFELIVPKCADACSCAGDAVQTPH